MSTRNLTEQADRARQQLEEHIAAADRDDRLIEILSFPAGAELQQRLEKDVETWEKIECWGPLDLEAVRSQGKALRSKELLEYFKGAEEKAKWHREEAMKLSRLLETAADQGRISRA
jgi:hypothetical protein